MAHPNSLIDLNLNEEEDESFDVLFNESFGYIAMNIYEKKCGGDIFDTITHHEKENLGQAWDFDNKEECLKRLPRLTKRYW